MFNRSFTITLFAAWIYAIISVPTVSATLTSSVNAENTLVTVSGVRSSQTAWGLGPDNYMAGVTTKQRLPGSGQLELWIVGTGSGGAIGNGTGYKALVQFWNDEQNYIALGVIHDPGPSPDGITVMVEGAAYNQPVGGYWGAGMPQLTSSRHHVVVTWTPDQISWVIDDYEAQRMTFNIKMDNPSFSILGATRLPGDSVSVNFEDISLKYDEQYKESYWELSWDDGDNGDDDGESEPTLEWNTFLGDSSCNGVAVDSNGNVYLYGASYNEWGEPIVGHSGGSDVFVAKLNREGVLQWNTFLGSTNSDYALNNNQ